MFASYKYLYVCIRVIIRVIITDFAAALANPIAYQSQLEKHARQLAILEDFDSEVKDISCPRLKVHLYRAYR